MYNVRGGHIKPLTPTVAIWITAQAFSAKRQSARMSKIKMMA